MRALLIILVVLVTATTAGLAATSPDQFAGDWMGTLDAGMKLRLAIHLVNTGGVWSGTMDSLDQGANGIAFTRGEGRRSDAAPRDRGDQGQVRRHTRCRRQHHHGHVVTGWHVAAARSRARRCRVDARPESTAGAEGAVSVSFRRCHHRRTRRYHAGRNAHHAERQRPVPGRVSHHRLGSRRPQRDRVRAPAVPGAERLPHAQRSGRAARR